MTVSTFNETAMLLTPFEKLILLSDGPWNPMTFRIVIRLRGVCVPDVFAATYQEAIRRHPLLSSRVESSRRGMHWVACSPSPLIVRSCDDIECDLESPESVQDGCDPGCEKFLWNGVSVPRLDVQTEPGLRTTLISSPTATMILVDAHHSCSDGNGVRQFVSDWFHLYDCALKGIPNRLTDRDHSALLERGSLRSLPPAETAEQPTGAKAATTGMREKVRNFLHTVRGRTAVLPPMLVTASTRETTESDSSRTYCTERRLSGAALDELKNRMQRFGVTVNDLLVAVCMREFSQLLPPNAGEHRVTVLNPVDLRLPSDLQLSAANRVGFAFLRRKMEDCFSAEKLLASIRDEMHYIKRGRIAGEFLKGLAFADRIPGGLRVAQKLQLFRPSLQMTCLGDVTRLPRRLFSSVDGCVQVGDLFLESVTGLPPVAPDVPFSVSVCLSQKYMTLAVRSGLRFVDRAESERFTDNLLRGILGQTEHQSSQKLIGLTSGDR